jgi:hypothetical protein
MCSSSTYHPHAPFDAVVCMGDTLLHVPSQEQVKRLLDDIYTHTRTGGKLLLSFRDFSSELHGIDRAIPVRLSEHGQMATFLEYTESHVNVHDMLFARNNGEWQMTKSAYQKLRLSGDEAGAMVAQAGFTNVQQRIDQGFTILAGEKP